MQPAIEDRAAALDQLLSELQDGNAWDSTISLLADYADLVQDLMQDRLAVRADERAKVVAEIVAELRSDIDPEWMSEHDASLIRNYADYIEAKFGGGDD